jgi:hypothetical protein
MKWTSLVRTPVFLLCGHVKKKKKKLKSDQNSIIILNAMLYCEDKKEIEVLHMVLYLEMLALHVTMTIKFIANCIKYLDLVGFFICVTVKTTSS